MTQVEGKETEDQLTELDEGNPGFLFERGSTVL